jgi:uncharacterized membrane protein YphA (DoxX/SURF4 family)
MPLPLRSSAAYSKTCQRSDVRHVSCAAANSTLFEMPTRLYALHVFPSGWPATGLLLLRVMTGAMLATHYALRLGSASPETPAVVACDAVLVVNGVSLTAGFLTPLSSLITAAGYLWILWSRNDVGVSVLIGVQAAFFGVVNATALAMLGPGALSIDSARFGRREIVISPD